MKTFGRAIWMALAVLAPLTGRAQTVFYGVDTSSTLYSIDAQTQVATSIGVAAYLEGLAISPTGQLYGTDTSGVLYSVDKTTGAATAIGNTGRGNIEALDFAGGILIGADFTSTPTLFSIDLSTGASTTLVTAGTLTGSTRAMAAVDANTVLIAADGAPNSLYSVNLTTGATSLLGTMTMTGQFLAMDFASNGVLYGFGNAGEVWEINPANGALTLLGNTGSQFWLDATTLAIPEPSTWLLLGTGLLSLVVTLRRRLA